MPRRILYCPAVAFAPAVLFGLTALGLVGCTHHPDATQQRFATLDTDHDGRIIRSGLSRPNGGQRVGTGSSPE